MKGAVTRQRALAIADYLVGHADTCNCPVPREWLRVSEACAYAGGITKPVLYGWINAGLVKSFCRREPGAIRGVRLISLPSLRAFLNGAKQVKQVKGKKGVAHG